MLDLDSLAQARAESVNEEAKSWHEAVWSAEFQKLSQSMSDGEVESLIAICPTVLHFRSVTHYLNQQLEVSGASPFTVLTKAAEQAGLALSEWIKSKMGEQKT